MSLLSTDVVDITRDHKLRIRRGAHYRCDVQMEISEEGCDVQTEIREEGCEERPACHCQRSRPSGAKATFSNLKYM